MFVRIQHHLKRGSAYKNYDKHIAHLKMMIGMMSENTSLMKRQDVKEI